MTPPSTPQSPTAPSRPTSASGRRWWRPGPLAIALAVLGLGAAEPARSATGGGKGRETVERSIAYHDPGGIWGTRPLELAIDESRPDGTERRTRVTFDPQAGRFTWTSERDGYEVAGRVGPGGSCQLTLDGGPVPPGRAEELGLNCESLLRRRDYYAFLWGLPMKLRDRGTRIGKRVETTLFDGRQVQAVRVTYDRAVGSDTWFFYFDPDTAALVGYRFHHDEGRNDGEYIILEGELEIDGLRLPRKRSWYRNRDGGYLGTDTLVAPEGGDAASDGRM
ncbi:MAG: DUF6503 family protein [Thermoanaerobaculia bacterium]|nr:DUF6503 family protein [Thermoanaerobaculia bacterium]